MPEENNCPPAGAPEIKVPPMPPMTDYEKIQIATENAFGVLIAEAKRLGLPVEPVMGLMYLPDQDVTRTFQTACQTVLDLLCYPGGSSK